MSDRALKVAVLSPAWFAVPPTGYGGIELVVSLLADGILEWRSEESGTGQGHPVSAQ